MQEEDTFPLTDLPDLPLERVAQCLSPADLISLSDSCSKLVHLRKYLPEYEDVAGENFNKTGPSDGHFCPEVYFDGPVMAQRMKSVRAEWDWRDQGYGNRKGMIWLQLLRGEEVMADSLEDYPTLAPHVRGPVGQMEREVLEIRDHPVVTRSRPGDRLRFMRNIGGGGGHKLKVKNFRVKIELKKY